jgi:NAD(P)-dependent dehydrogenase (short-subunit alcohol dehydrogenase family)
MRLKDRVAIVTGSGSGMGEAVARLFAEEGASVVVADLNASAAQSVATHIGARARAIEVDITQEPDVVDMVNRAVEAFGRVDILVNCAGMADFRKTEDTSLELWRRVVDVNLTGTFLCCREAGRRMIEGGGGTIVNIASTSGISGTPYMAAYSAAKHGVVGLTRELATEWGKHNIRVNCICPGATETSMLLGTTTETYRAERRKRVPLGKLGQPSEQAQAAMFLASPESSYVTGAVLCVDGGVFAMSPATSEAALAGD